MATPQLGRTIFLRIGGRTNNIVVIKVQRQVVSLQSDPDTVEHWYEVRPLAWRPSTPVFAQVGEKVDMIAKQKDSRLLKNDIEGPLSLCIPKWWCWQMTYNLVYGKPWR